jgi:PTS system mannose-specific IIC component
LSLCRFALNTGFFDRPIVIGLLAGFFYGQWPTCIGLAVFFELLWLDLFPAGTYIPPHRTLTTFATIVLSCEMQLGPPTAVVPVIVLGLLLARLGAWLEARQRSMQNASYDRIHQRIGEGEGELPLGRIVLGSMAQIAVFNAALFALVAVAIFGLSKVYFFEALTLPGGLGWPHLWALGLVGGLLALRIRRAYEMFVAGSLVCLLVLLW